MEIPVGPTGGRVVLPGDLVVPKGAVGIVLFAHGSGSSRLSPRNRAVAAVLQGAGMATLLFDLLSEDEAADRRNVFDVELLAGRLMAATRWVRRGSGAGEVGSSAPPHSFEPQNGATLRTSILFPRAWGACRALGPVAGQLPHAN